MSTQENPFVGTWVANLPKSKRHPDNQFRQAMIEFAMDGASLTITDVVIDSSGQEEKGKNTILVDGKEHPSTRGNGYFITAAWTSSHVLQTMAKKDGQIVGLGRYAVSDDGTTLTISTDQQQIVCDRQ